MKANLNAEQLEHLQLVARGYSPQEIAQKRNTSEVALCEDLSGIKEALEVQTIAQAIVMAMRNGLITASALVPVVASIAQKIPRHSLWT